MLHSLRSASLRMFVGAALLVGTGAARAQPSPTPSAATAVAAAPALRYLRDHAAAFGLREADLSTLAVTGSYADEHNGIAHTYLCQQLDGRAVPGTEVGLHFNRAGALLMHTGNFVTDLRAQATRLTPPAIGAEAATVAASRHLRQPGLRAPQPATLVYIHQPDNTLHTAWQVQLNPAKGPDAWTVLVDATTGRVLKARNRVIREPRTVLSTMSAPAVVGSTAARGPAVANGYRVFAAPLENPLFGPATAIPSPADAVASPFGWHDTNGAAGAEFTTARGNNAHAYTPLANYAAGFSPDGGPTLEFDAAFDPALSASANQPAALTNLFYWANLMHDVSQRYGFTEASGNFQATNYSGTGVGDDYIRAQIGENYSEAYFNPTLDGATANNYPEIMLGPWQTPQANGLTVTAPAAAAGSYAVMTASFGRQLPRTTPISGNLVLANDGSPNPTYGCRSPWTNTAQVQGNIAVVDYNYDCSLTNQVRNARQAGATAIVVVNNLDFLVHLDADPADTMGLRIPMVMITRADGQRIKNALAIGGTVAGSLLGATPAPDRNGGFENGVIAHEYAHGISTRLTGGPAGAIACLDNAEQMGEGWSDFFELWMTTRPGDVGATARGIGTYILGQATTGPGIRPLPYSTDFAVNNATYAFIGQTVNGVNYGNYPNSNYPEDQHATGFVWCTVLWDLNWAMIQRYGYDANIYTGTGGNNKTMQLIMDGLKLQPCSPGFLDGRDAILAADRATFGGANQALIWQVFARRGMGSNAVQGSSDDLTDNTAGFLVPAVTSTTSALAPAALDLYPNPTQGLLTLRLAQPAGNSAAVAVTVETVLGQTVRAVTLPATTATAGALLDLRALAAGVYVVRVSTPAGALTRRVVVQP
ncbi:M36 family metallopeptidase [Hymenobacter negativus]|uniref:M36 family metallopeptidase n=1 Tax=Hymenobacter negativus TaxID=2795026 RepID=A0ABS3QEQ5_9BACT|nr:M36 family metallopeptidase [Hymenobacter negativus]MBO2009294.1 M36 family metallopeptidase [Hymenobacter negativus]